MPIVAEPFVFSEESATLVAETLSRPGYTHHDWSSQPLQELRRLIREHYRNSQRLQCAYCLEPVASVSATGAPIEHIVPKSLHPRFAFEAANLCVICPDCNEIKRQQETLNDARDPLKRRNARRYPARSQAFKIVHPHFDEYADHIIKLGRVFVGRSPKGDWTITACRLNRFFHRFGMCQELLDDVNLIGEQQLFHARGQ
ncbi:HNH endonuclease [Luteimonas sp. BDR2-5]|uniref:HNH endonuclease n=1 Tax=Proluteimonas luteida TaxID=2878685 RepID=UPI001E511F5B|nr:HNH endonuclease [Luteimonas sp. BDR2-5]MCD9026783.1 HNH endonuclease [Luteimonas sp. BDR2-5]